MSDSGACRGPAAAAPRAFGDNVNTYMYIYIYIYIYIYNLPPLNNNPP